MIRVDTHITHSKYIHTSHTPSTYTANGGDQTSNIWISRSIGFFDRTFEWRGLRLLNWKSVSNFGDSHENVFDMYGDPRENLFNILAVVIIVSPISFVCGLCHISSTNVQPIPRGVTFSNAVSKLKAQSSKVSFHWNVTKETFELWALSFRKYHPKCI